MAPPVTPVSDHPAQVAGSHHEAAGCPRIAHHCETPRIAPKIAEDTPTVQARTPAASAAEKTTA